MKTKHDVSKIEVLRPTNALMPTGKKGAVPIIGGIIAVCAVIGGGYAIYNWIHDDDSGDSDAPPLTVTKTVTMPDGTNKTIVETLESPDQNNCGDAKTTSADFIVLNPLDMDGTPTYTSVGLKVKAADGSGTLKGYTTDSDGTFAGTSLGLDCGDDFYVYAPAGINTTASAFMAFKTDGPYFDTELEVETIDLISVKAYDNDNNGDVWTTSNADEDTSKDYTDLDTASVTFQSVTNNTAHAMGVGGELDWTFKMKVGSQSSWGDLKNYIAVDADASDYAKPTMSFDGAALIEVGKGALDADDQGYLASYEYIFELPYDITETTSELRLKVNAKSSINPDVDIVVKPVAESYWVDGTNLKRSIFKSDGTEVLTTSRTITLDVS